MSRATRRAKKTLVSVLNFFGIRAQLEEPQGYTDISNFKTDDFEFSHRFMDYVKKFPRRADRFFSITNVDQYNGRILDLDIYQNHRLMQAELEQQRVENEEAIWRTQVCVQRELALIPLRKANCQERIDYATKELERLEAAYEALRRADD